VTRRQGFDLEPAVHEFEDIHGKIVKVTHGILIVHNVLLSAFLVVAMPG
jgi:hypothetical protein